MIAFNQDSNAITSITRFDNEDSSYPKTNLLNEYTRSLAKTTATSTVIEFTFAGREFCLLNCNATSGVIYADKPSAASTTISSSTTISTDTDYEGTLIISGGSTIVDVTSNATLRVHGTFGKDDESITFNIDNLKRNDLYFDMGSVGVWTVSLSLSIGSGVLEMGALVGGTFTQYGNTETATRGAKEFNSQLTSANFESLQEVIKNDDSFVVIPDRGLAESDIFIAYGKITLNQMRVSGRKFDNTSGRYIDNTNIKVT